MGVKGAFYFGIVVMIWWITVLGSPWYMDMIQVSPPGDVELLCVNNPFDPNPRCTDEEIDNAQVADPEEVVECWLYGNCRVVGEKRWNNNGTGLFDILYAQTSDGTDAIDDDLSAGYGAAAALIYIAFVIYIIYWMLCLFVAWKRYHGYPTYGVNAVRWFDEKVPEEELSKNPKQEPIRKKYLSIFWFLALNGILSLAFIFIAVMVFGFNYDTNGKKAFLPIPKIGGGVNGFGDQSITEFTQVELTFVIPGVTYIDNEGTIVADGQISAVTGIRTTTAHVGWVLALVLLVPLSASIVALPAGG